MKTYLKCIIVLIIAAISLAAQALPHLGISSSREKARDICELDFKYFFPDPEEINNDYLYKYELSYLRDDSVETDTLIFFCYAFDKMSIKEISFSRNGTPYLSEDSFPVRDSVKWKLIKNELYTDSLVLQDSLLFYKPEYPKNVGNEFLWLLEKKHFFYEGDTLRLLMDEKPNDLRVGVQEMYRFYTPVSSSSSQQVTKLVLIDKKSTFLHFLQPVRQPIFDLHGRKHVILPCGPCVVLSRPQ